MQNKNKFLEIEAIRGLAALLVALYHFPNSSIIYDNPIIKNSDIMVDLFFVMSGFVISYGYFEKIENLKNVVNFQIKRFWRLYPLHIVTFIVFFVIDCLRILTIGVSGEGEGNWLLAVYNLLLVHAIFSDQLSFNFPSWSISTEFFTYLAFAVIMLCPARFKTAAIIASLLLSFIFAFFFDAFHDVAGYPILRCFYGFFFGATIQRVFVYLIHQNARLFLYPSIMTIMSIMTLIFYAYIPSWFPVIIYAGLVLSLAQYAGRNVLSDFLNIGILQYLGKISYSIYMWHILIGFVINRGVQYAFGFEGIFIPTIGVSLALDIMSALMITLVYIVAVIVVSSLSYRYIEQRFIYKRHSP